jgi:zinc protease
MKNNIRSSVFDLWSFYKSRATWSRQTLPVRKVGLPPLFLLLSLITFISSSAAQTGTSTASQVTEFDINGLKVLVKRRPGTPTVAAGLFFRGGSRNLTAANAGIEKLTLAVATEATKNYPRQRLRKELSRMGTVISSGANPDYSALSLISTKLSFDTSWKIFKDAALNPSFLAEDVSRVRDNMLTALRASTDSPEGLLEDTSDRVIYAGHPYVNSPNGTIESVSKLKSEDLTAYHKRLLETSRMLLVVVGDVEPDVVKTRVTEAFGTLPRGDGKQAALPPLKFDQGSVDVTSRGVETNYVKGIFAAPSLSDPDYYAMRTAVTLLQTAVFQEVRVKRNLSYAPDAELDAFASNTAAISVTSTKPNDAVDIMLGEIKKLRQLPVSEDDIARMAGYFLTTYYLKQETNAAQAGELAQWELIGGGWRNAMTFLDKMRAVKPADIQAAANKYMRNIRFVVVGKPDEINRSVFVPAAGL